MRILIASPIFPATIEELQEEHDVVCAFSAKREELKDLIRDRQILTFRSGVSITADVMACSPDLKLLIRAGSGIDNLDEGFVHGRGIQLVRIPEPGAKAVAEMSFALMLALARNLLQADRLLRQGKWAKHELTGYLLTGKTLGIVGVGNIGSRVGRLGAAWGMEVIGYDKIVSPAMVADLKEKGIRLSTFDEVLYRSDFLSIHVPLCDSTRYLINAETLARMKRGAFLINLARGGVVDERALCHELREGGRLRGAALDVHEEEGDGKMSPLAKLPNVILTPHIGAGTIDSQREIGKRIMQIIASFSLKQELIRSQARIQAA